MQILAGLLLSLLVAPGMSSSGKGTEARRSRQSEQSVLAPGAQVERELQGGESHSYQFTLIAGQYASVSVAQRGIDVALKIFGPDGGEIAEVNNRNDTQQTERVSLVAKVSGTYRLEIRSVEKDSTAGRYQARIDEIRESLSKDQTRVDAERAYAEGQLLRKQGTVEAQRKAIKKYEEALPLWRALADRKEEAETLHGIGSLHSLLGEKRKALEYYSKALPLRRESGDRLGEATTLHNIGAVYWFLGDQGKALEYYNQALPLRREVNDLQGEASTLSNMGSAYSAMGEFQKAIDYYEKSLIPRRAAKDRAGEAETLGNLGLRYDSLGEPLRALEYHQQSLRIRQAVGDRRGEAYALLNIGRVHFGSGNYQQAQDFWNRSLPLWRLVGDRRGEAVTLSQIGTIYAVMGEPLRSLDYQHQALEILRAIEDRRFEANTLRSIGRAHQQLGDTREALDYYNQALKILRPLAARYEEALTLNDIGWLYYKSKENSKALENLTASLSISRETGERSGESGTLRMLGNVYWQLGESEKALDYCRQALAIQREIRNVFEEAETLNSIAYIERDLGNLNEARLQNEAALNLIESVRAKVAGRNSRASFLATNEYYYNLEIDLLMRLHNRRPSEGHDAEALQASERAHARTLLDTLAESGADIRQGVESSLLDRERNLQQLINVKAQRLTRLLGGKRADERSEEAKKELDSLLAEYEDTQAQIRLHSPGYAALTQPQPLGLKEIQQRVLDPDTLLLEYSLGDERSYLWAVTTTSIKSFELPKRYDVESSARRFYELVTNGNKREIQTQIRLAATELSRIILGPVAAELGNKRLLIVSDGALQYVPFNALLLPVTETSAGSRPLIAEHEIDCVPSASTLAVLRQTLAGRKSAEKTVAVVADPVLQSDDPRITQVAKTEMPETNQSSSRSAPDELLRSAKDVGVAGFARLPYTRSEADGIVALAQKETTLEALDFEANRQRALSPEFGQYRIVHYATHGVLDSVHPELSGIVLSLVDEHGQPQDGFLRLHDIYNLRLGADLVVLSACRTALGKEVRGEGLVGLTRGFMYAGAPRVVASLWDVKDEATAILMNRFYRGMLKNGLRPAAALRAAQISMAKEPRWQSPYYWSGFVLQGEWK